MSTELTKTENTIVKLDDGKRQSLVEQMTDALLWKFEEIRAFVIDEAISIFKRRHRLGRMVLEVTKDPDKYGKQAVEQMSSLLNMDNSLLYNAKLFAERYSENDLDELTKLRNNHGDSLTWSHVVQLIRVPDRDARLKLQQETVDNNWTYQELLKFVQDAKGGKTSKGGRPLAKPSDLSGVVTQIESMSSKWLRCNNEIWVDDNKGVAALADELSEDKFNTKIIVELRDLENKVKMMATAADVLADELASARVKLEASLDSPKAIRTVKSRSEPVIS